MGRLKTILTEDQERLPIGVEIVTSRAYLNKKGHDKIISFIGELTAFKELGVKYVSFTDSAGGIPGFESTGLLEVALKDDLIPLAHMTCRDKNRIALENRFWLLHHADVEDVLAITGDGPVAGFMGCARKDYDFDSAALVALLHEMNTGIKDERRGIDLEKTNFTIGVAVNPYKLSENEQIPQYLKLKLKVNSGADFIIPQIGYDIRKFHELFKVMSFLEIEKPVIANAYFLSKGTVRAFREGYVPGVTVPDNLYEAVQKGGREFCLNLVAKQMAVAEKLGAKGIHLGGTHKIDTVEEILRRYDVFRKSDLPTLVEEANFSTSGQFYFFGKNKDTGLNNDSHYIPSSPKKKTFKYKSSCLFHNVFFEKGRRVGKKLYNRIEEGSTIDNALHQLEKASKSFLYGCKDCGTCYLSEFTYLCPESGCGKGIYNGPCGGSVDGMCEVNPKKQCFYVLVYDRLRSARLSLDGAFEAVRVKDRSTQDTSAWRNFFLAQS